MLSGHGAGDLLHRDPDMGSCLVEKGNLVAGRCGISAQHLRGVEPDQEAEIAKAVFCRGSSNQEMVVSICPDGELEGGIVTCPAVVIPGHEKLVIDGRQGL